MKKKIKMKKVSPAEADSIYEQVAELLVDLTPAQINKVLKSFGMFTYPTSYHKARGGVAAMDIARAVLFIPAITIEVVKEKINLAKQ